MDDTTTARMLDPDASFFTYIVKDRANYGRFQIDSVCTVRNASGTDRYYVLHPVMACDVYGLGPLIKEPAYRFQAAFSKDRFRIFRTYLDTGRRDDTSGPIDRTFEGIELSEQLVEMRLLDSNREIVGAARTHGRMFGRITFDQGSGHHLENVTVEFPVRHINTDPTRDAFQVETGTVALPDDAIDGRDVIERLSICYVAFNTLTEMSILSLPVSPVVRRKCTIRLYGSGMTPEKAARTRGSI